MTRYHILIACVAALAASPSFAKHPKDLPDRPISRSEILALLDHQFQEMDTNHDGRITRDEFEAYRARQDDVAPSSDLAAFAHVGPHWFDKADKHGNGFVTPKEAGAHLLKMFDMADSNHDGVIDHQEREAVEAMMREK
jgi:Ca2+-binding EF-hand superfamily protein